MNQNRLIAAMILSLGLHAAILSLSGRFASSPVEVKEVVPSLAVVFQETERTSVEAPLLEESPPSAPPHEVFGSIGPDGSSVEPGGASDAAEAAEKPATALAEGHGPDTPASAESAIPDGSPAPTTTPVVTEPVLLGDLDPEYPTMARRMGLEGTVVLILTIDENGRPVDHRILKPRAHRLLEDAAVETAMSAVFKPGTRNSRPVSDTLQLRIVFRLEA